MTYQYASQNQVSVRSHFLKENITYKRKANEKSIMVR